MLKMKDFLSFRFYVKSILENLTILEALNFVNVADFSLKKVQKIMKVEIQSIYLNVLKWHILHLFSSPKLISRKICVIEKL